LNSPLLNNNDIRGARNILLNITSGDKEVTMDEVGKITDYLQNMAGFDADLIWGNGKDETLGDDISVTLIATGFGNSSIPEITGDRKPEKETHLLKEDGETENSGFQKKSSAKKSTSASDQKTFSFNDSEEASDDDMEFEVLYPKTNKARKNIENAKMDFSSASDEDLDELENIPAYKRRQLRMNDPKYKKKLSNYSVNNENKLTDKNSYLHGQAD
jgi:cell division protein FtsZ